MVDGIQAPIQYVVRSIDLRTIVKADFNLTISPEEEKQYFIKQADSQYLRQIRRITGVSSKYNPYIIFVDINYHKDIAVILSRLTLEGIKIRGRKFVLGERSASMVRQGVLSMVDASIAQELEERVTMGLKIEETVLSKWYAYRGLMLSSAHCVENYVPKIIVVPDLMTISMILISKEEAEYLRQKFPNLNIVRTMKAHSQRHRYYAEESQKVLTALKNYDKEKAHG